MENPNSPASQKDTEALVDEVDVEEYSKRGEKPPRARRYRVRVDKDRFTFDHAIVTGREILQKAGKVPPDRFELYQKVHGAQPKKVGLDEQVDLSAPGVERFQTIPLEATEG